MISITVLTATLNAADVIDRLASDLLRQNDQDFTWLIVDGGSSDDTLDRIPKALNRKVVIIQESDFGIYDALNRGIRRCSTTHYLVAGADDRLAQDAIERYKAIAAETGADIVAACVIDNGKIARPNRGKSWLRGQNAFISHHSVGTLIRRNLHETVGTYSNCYPIAADQYFIKSAVKSGAKIHYANDLIAGEFSRSGVSSRKYLACQFEFTLVQLQTERFRSLQLLILIFRLLRHWRLALR